MNVLRFLRWMADRGWPVILYARPDGALYEHALETGIAARTVAPGIKYGGPRCIYNLARLISGDRLGTLIIHRSRDIPLGVLARKFCRRSPLLIYQQHMHIGGSKRDFMHAWEYRQFDALVTPLPILARQVLEKTVVPADRVHIIPLGIELERYTSDRPTKLEARQRLNIPPAIPLLGIVGRLDPKKGQAVVVRALRRVLDAGEQLSLVMVGARTQGEATGYEAEVRRLIGELHLGDKVYIRDYLPRTEYAFAALDYFALASQSETYGMVTIEAMASRLPVMATASGGTVDIIQPNHNGLLFTPDSDSELAEGLLRYLRAPDFARRIAAQAEQDAMEKYSHEKQCAAWERLIRGLLGGN